MGPAHLLDHLHARRAPGYVLDVMGEYLDATLTPLSLRARPGRPENPIVLSVVRNENERLPEFLRHYREAGIEAFAIVDNGSLDGTAEYLADQPDVDLYRCERPFHWTRKQGWLSILVSIYGRHRWYVHADGDEHIVFDGMEDGTTFADICARMDARGLHRIRGVLVDMYAEGPLLGTVYERGDRLCETYALFDAGPYIEERYREIVSQKGGPRQRVFGGADPRFRPELTKYPVFRLWDGDVFANPHHIWPYARNFESGCVLGILHYKFLPDVASRIQDAIERGNYWDESIEYQCYRDVLKERPELDLRYAGSMRYDGARSLVDHSLIRPRHAVWDEASIARRTSDRKR